jgi:hypothetical protein
LVVVGLVCAACAACEAGAGGTAADAADVTVDQRVLGDAPGDTAIDTASDAAVDAQKETASVDTAVTDTVVADTSVDGDQDAPVDTARVIDTVNDTLADAVGPQPDATKAADTATDTGKCAAPQPPNTVCEGSNWVCAPEAFHGYGKTECLAATCDNLAAEKNEAIQKAVEAAQKCQGGDNGGEDGGECIVVPTSTDCGGTCGAAVNAGMQNDVLKVVGWVDDNLCKKFGYKAKCGYSTPKCQAPKPVCGKGMCWYAPQ